MLRKVPRVRRRQATCIAKINTETNHDDIFHKISKEFRQVQFNEGHNNRIIRYMKGQINRKDINYSLRKDYRSLLDLVRCQSKIKNGHNKSMKVFHSIQQIHDSRYSDHRFNPVKKHIEISGKKIQRKKYKNEELDEYRKHIRRESTSSNTMQMFIESIISRNMKGVKDFIPIQSRFFKKINILGKLGEQQKDEIIQEVKIFLEKQKQNSTEQQFNTKYQIYLVNYFLIRKMMIRICENPEFLTIKNQNFDLYESIKKEMMEDLTNEKRLQQIINQLDQYDRNRQINRNSFKSVGNSIVQKKLKPKTANINKRGFFKKHDDQMIPQKGGKQKQIIKQFNHFFNLAFEKVQEAQLIKKRRNNFIEENQYL